MWYVLRVVLCDEYTDSSDATASDLYGPYRTRRKAEAVASAVRRAIPDACASVEPVKRATTRSIIDALHDLQEES